MFMQAMSRSRRKGMTVISGERVRFAVLSLLPAAALLFSATDSHANPHRAKWPPPRGVTPTAVAVSSDESANAEKSAESASSSWYGWQTLGTDAAGIGLLIAAGASPENSGVLIGVGAPMLVLGAPVVHAAHGRWGTGAASLGIRVGVILVSSLSFSGNCSGECGEQWLLPLLLVPLPTVIDATVLAYESAPRLPSKSTTWTLHPRATLRSHTAILGFSGTF